MNYRFASNFAGTALASPPARDVLPHLVCSWTIDPASRRLSCVWATPTDHWNMAAMSAQLVATHLSPGIPPAVCVS
jgi:hypothetical protein